MDPGQAGVQLRGPLQVVARAGILAGPELHRAHEQAGLGRIAVAQDAVEEDLAALHLPVLDERQSEQVRHRPVVGAQVVERPQQRRGLAVLAEAGATLGEQHDRVAALRRRGHHALQLGRGVGRTAGLLEGDRQVEPDGGAAVVES